MQLLLTGLAVVSFALAYWGRAESWNHFCFLTASVSRRHSPAVSGRNNTLLVCEKECEKEKFFPQGESEEEKFFPQGESEEDSSDKEAENKEKLSEVGSEKEAEKVERFFIGEPTEKEAEQQAEQPLEEYNSVKAACYYNWQLVAGTFLRGLQVNRSAEITAELEKYFKENPQPRKRVATKKQA